MTHDTIIVILRRHYFALKRNGLNLYNDEGTLRDSKSGLKPDWDRLLSSSSIKIELQDTVYRWESVAAKVILLHRASRTLHTAMRTHFQLTISPCKFLNLL